MVKENGRGFRWPFEGSLVTKVLDSMQGWIIQGASNYRFVLWHGIISLVEALQVSIIMWVVVV